MQVVNIQTNVGQEVLESIKSLLISIDPNTTMTYEEEQDYILSQEDVKKFKDICEKSDKGELKCMSFEEFDRRNNEYLRSLGADI